MEEKVIGEIDKLASNKGTSRRDIEEFLEDYIKSILEESQE